MVGRDAYVGRTSPCRRRRHPLTRLRHHTRSRDWAPALLRFLQSRTAASERGVHCSRQSPSRYGSLGLFRWNSHLFCPFRVACRPGTWGSPGLHTTLLIEIHHSFDPARQSATGESSRGDHPSGYPAQGCIHTAPLISSAQSHRTPEYITCGYGGIHCSCVVPLHQVEGLPGRLNPPDQPVDNESFLVLVCYNITASQIGRTMKQPYLVPLP